LEQHQFYKYEYMDNIHKHLQETWKKLEEANLTPTNVDSTAIIQSGYSRKKKILYIRFEGDPSVVYAYNNISRFLKDKFKFSPSKGQFFHKFIKDKFDFDKILGG